MSFGDRRKPLKTKKPLKASVEKARDWQRRSRKRMRPKSETPRRRPERPAGESARRRAWTQAVFRLYGFQSVVLPADGRGYPKADHAHHAVPKSILEHVAPALKFDPRGGVPVDWNAHLAHENGSRRIKHAELPQGVIDWAREHGFDWYVDDPRHYP